MSDQLNAFEALAMIPGWDPESVDIEELKGGLTNRTYYVRQGDTESVLRLDSHQADLFQFSRPCELAIIAEASDAGLAPAVIFSDVDAGILLTEFVPGRVWDESDLESTHNLEAMAGLLRKVHALPSCNSQIDIAGVAATYESYLEKRHGLHAFASKCVEIIDAIPTSDLAVCCHNDIVAANLIENSNLKLIDWEFACDNDPMFDLASAIGFHNLDEKRAAILLDAYTGGDDGEMKARLADQVRIYDAIQWLWLATRHLVFPSRWQAKRLEQLQQRIR